MIDFRTIEQAICDELRAEGLEVISANGDYFFQIATGNDEEGPFSSYEWVSVTKIADRVAGSLESSR